LKNKNKISYFSLGAKESLKDNNNSNITEYGHHHDRLAATPPPFPNDRRTLILLSLSPSRLPDVFHQPVWQPDVFDQQILAKIFVSQALTQRFNKICRIIFFQNKSG